MIAPYHHFLSAAIPNARAEERNNSLLQFAFRTKPGSADAISSTELARSDV